MSIRIPRPQPGTVIALAALGVALGGTSYAAATIGTTDLRNGAVTSAKIRNGHVRAADLAAGSVGTAKIRAGAVTTVRLADGSVATAKIADGAVTAAKLGDDAVTPAKVADDAIGAAAIAPSSVGTSEITDAAITADDIADGQVVKGRGRMVFRTRTLTPGSSSDLVALDTVPGLGRFGVACGAGGVGTFHFTVTSQAPVVVTYTAAGKGQALAVDRLSPGPGGVVTVPNPGFAIQLLTMQVAQRDDPGNVATIWASTAPAGTLCITRAQALTSE